MIVIPVFHHLELLSKLFQGYDFSTKEIKILMSLVAD